MHIFDKLKFHEIEYSSVPLTDGASKQEERAKAIFSNITVQRCIVHLMRNSIRYIPRKQ